MKKEYIEAKILIIEAQFDEILTSSLLGAQPGDNDQNYYDFWNLTK